MRWLGCTWFILRRIAEVNWSYSPSIPMDGHTLIIEWIGIILALIFGVTMFCQGHAIFHGKYGYKHSEREKKKMSDARKQLEDIIKDK